jgi:hypothetical protein
LLAVSVGVANLAVEAEITGDRTADAILEQANLPQGAIAVESTWGLFGLGDIPRATCGKPKGRTHQGSHGHAKQPRALCESIHHLLFSSLDLPTAHVRRRSLLNLSISCTHIPKHLWRGFDMPEGDARYCHTKVA